MAKKRKTSKKKKNNYYVKSEFKAFFIVLFSILSFISIFLKDKSGILGDWLGTMYFSLFGIASYAFPFLFVYIGLSILYGKIDSKQKRNMISVIILFTLFLTLIGTIQISNREDFPFVDTIKYAIEDGKIYKGAGIIGATLAFLLTKFIGKIGTYILVILFSVMAVLTLLDVTVVNFLKGIANGIKRFFTFISNIFKSLIIKIRNSLDKNNKKKKVSNRNNKEISKERKNTKRIRIPNEKEEEIIINDYRNRNKKPVNEKTSQITVEDFDLDVDSGAIYIKPPLELLREPKETNKNDDEGLIHRADIIVETLESFGINSKIVAIDRGPTVTLFQLKPESGVKVSRILNLSDDLALALAATDVRIEAPIPGKPYVGIEVPNKRSDVVYLKEILLSDEYVNSTDEIPVTLGKSISGKPVVANIEKMPHLLIAGATGSGKSICINTIIISILYRFTPDEVKLLLIDPKVVELSNYNDVPHLISKVVTDPQKAASSLKSVEKMMEDRYKTFAEYGVKNITAYKKLKEESNDENMKNLPYILVIIDELADLMMTSANSVETSIARLAQLARACGIHLIIATQRPSVDVITGIIKANIPSRISFQVSSQVDSRTILDQGGAEKLLGKGDMLYYPANFSKPLRVQGAFISGEEVTNITEFIKNKNNSDYNEEFVKDLNMRQKKVEIKEEADELLPEVLDYIVDQGSCSISALQRRFSIGYARAGRIVDYLERAGYVSPQEGSKPREVFTGKIEEGRLNELSE